MRDDIPLAIPHHLVRDARLYACTEHDLSAVIYVLERYPKVVAEVRQLRSRVAQLDLEGADFDARLHVLQDACRAILDL